MTLDCRLLIVDCLKPIYLLSKLRKKACCLLALMETFFLVVLVGLGVQIEILLIRTGVDVGKGG